MPDARCPDCGAEIKAPSPEAPSHCPGCGKVIYSRSGAPPPPPSQTAAPQASAPQAAPPRAVPPRPVAPRARPRRRIEDVDDESGRAHNLRVLGTLLLVGFILPVLEVTDSKSKVTFANIVVLGDEDASAAVKFLFLYPALAGLAVVALGAAARGVGRSVALIAIGLLPLLVLAGAGGVPSALELAAEVADEFWEAALALWLVGFVCLFAGSRARVYRPEGRAAAFLGAAGGILYLASLLVPCGFVAGGGIALLEPFHLMGRHKEFVIGLGTLGSMGCLVAASILCVANVTRGPSSQARASWAFRLVVVACAVPIVGAFANVLATSDDLGLGQEVSLSLATIKGACWVLPLLLLVPVGLADMVLNLSVAAGEPEDAAAGGAKLPYGPYARLVVLKWLLDDNAITAEDFTRKKRDVLSEL